MIWLCHLHLTPNDMVCIGSIHSDKTQSCYVIKSYIDYDILLIGGMPL